MMQKPRTLKLPRAFPEYGSLEHYQLIKEHTNVTNKNNLNFICDAIMYFKPFSYFNNLHQNEILKIIRAVDINCGFTRKYDLIFMPSFTTVAGNLAENILKFDIRICAAGHAEYVIKETLKNKGIDQPHYEMSNVIRLYWSNNDKPKHRNVKQKQLLDIKRELRTRTFRIYPELVNYENEIENFNFGLYAVYGEIKRWCLASYLIGISKNMKIEQYIFKEYISNFTSILIDYCNKNQCSEILK